MADQVGETLLLHRGLEICDDLLRADGGVSGPGGDSYDPSTEYSHHAATVDDLLASPQVREPAAALLRLPPNAPDDQVRAASQRLAEAVRLPSIATEVYYLLRGSPADSGLRMRRLRRALRRVHLSNLQRRFVIYHRRQLAMTQALHDVYLKEMRTGRLLRYQRSRARIEILRQKLLHPQYHIWGIRRRLNAPLQRETFWKVVQLLEGVRIANPVQVARGYPHELSGGMLQRAMIAMALSCEPDLLIADEPTTALDVTIQAQILELMRDLRERVGTAIVLITHDLGVVAEVCDIVHVMYAGAIIESAPVKELFRRPLHPYSQGLLASIPRVDQPDKQLTTIQGSVPNLITPPPGCRFHPRCPYAMPICKEVRPRFLLEGPDHYVACHLYGAGGAEGARPSVPPSGGALPASAPAPPLRASP